MNLNTDNFSRAPGTISKATTSTATSNTNLGVGGILQPDGYVDYFFLINFCFEIINISIKS